MSYQPESEKSAVLVPADSNAQHPQCQPPTSQCPTPRQYPSPGQYYPSQPQPGTELWGLPPTQYSQGQQRSRNVVVVAAPTVMVTQQPRVPNYLTPTIVGLILCLFFGGVVGMLLLVPALICSIMAQNANDSGDHDTARKLGQFSRSWNVGVYTFYTLATIAWVVAVVVVDTQSVVSVPGCVRINGRFACG